MWILSLHCIDVGRSATSLSVHLIPNSSLVAPSPHVDFNPGSTLRETLFLFLRLTTLVVMTLSRWHPKFFAAFEKAAPSPGRLFLTLVA
jgi:hypothetical protein